MIINMNNYYIFILLVLFHLIGNIKLIEASENSTIENDNIMLQEKNLAESTILAYAGVAATISITLN